MAKFNLGVHGSHNAAIALSYGGDVLEVVELERWVQIKNAAFFYYHPILNPIEILNEILDYFDYKYGAKEFDYAMVNSWSEEHYKDLRAKNVVYVPHHIAHACNVMYHSEAKESLIVSFDGGSDNGHFNIYLGNKTQPPQLIYQSPKDLCVPYAALGHYMKDITRERDFWFGNLTYAGKVMGLSAYGKRNDEMFDRVTKLYEQSNTNQVDVTHQNWDKIFCSCMQSYPDSANLAYANQYLFEKNFADIVTPFMFRYPNRELQFTGGGAMNIINNTTYKAFVSPNSDDRGIALGCLLSLLKPLYPVDSTYLGSEPYDDMPKANPVNIKQIEELLNNNKILGLVQGRSEHGARALGNRSILCLPKKGVKERLNTEVKKREWFRPFAAVCREENANRFFKTYNRHRWMTHNVKVTLDDFPAITHADKTCRLQTVNKKQNKFLYDLLENHPVLLNTSFNIQGKPILNTYKEAVWMKENTGIDEIITDKYILE